MKLHILAFFVLILTISSGWSQESVTINFSNFSFDDPTQTAVLLRDGAGNPLSQGVAAANTDGFLVQLGYYSTATAANNFAGTWIPITGFGAALHTSIGDSQNLSGSGNGIIDFVTIFGGLNLNTTNVQVYAPGNAGAYLTQSSIPITTTQPPNNQVMSIRFYDTAAGTSGHFNAVSNDSWLFVSPNTVGTGPTYSLADDFATLEFQDSANPFKTTILIPEPSTYLLLGIGALAVIGYRRRQKATA